MGFKYTNSLGRTYVLHKRNSQLKSGHMQTVYYFKSNPLENQTVATVPDGYLVTEAKNSMLFLRRRDR